MANVSEIREQLMKLLASYMSLEDFENWFVPYSWNIHKLGDLDAQRLAYAIEHQLSEFDEDCEALRRGLMEALLPFAENLVAENRYGSPIPITPEFGAAVAMNASSMIGALATTAPSKNTEIINCPRVPSCRRSTSNRVVNLKPPGPDKSTL